LTASLFARQRGWRVAAAALAAAALCSCANVVVPTQVRFPSLRPGPDRVQMFDTRPAQAREYREEGQGPAFKFLGDDGIEPSPVGLVASCIAEALPAAQRGRPIELRRLDIGFLVAPRSLLPSGSGTSISIASGTPAAAIAAGLLLVYGMISSFTHGRADPSGVAYIEVWIGTESLRTAQTVAVARNGSASEAVEAALATALDDLAEQARALGSRAQGLP
jgi:hypothetical protein